MKFPIGYQFTHKFMMYEVVDYKNEDELPYVVKFGFVGDKEDDFDVIQMNEGELTVASDLGD